jgi:hypothetical protein|tara:strand:+ start:1244 stop:1969 length:726 start_codon:yes stop_codon:yes gene_type:complete
MISKSQLTSVISKYYLNGLNNQVKWRIKDKTLTIYAGEAGRVCKVILNDFQLEDAELGVFDTNKLNKLISITNGDLVITLEKLKSIYTKMHIADSNFDLTYSLADTLILGKNVWYDDPEEWAIELDLTAEDIDHLIKAKNALGDTSSMLISTTVDFDSNNVCEFLFGDNTGFSNKITYLIQNGTINDTNLSIPFNSDIFKDILNANKDQDTCSLKMSKEGILKLTFGSETINSEYFIARNE